MKAPIVTLCAFLLTLAALVGLLATLSPPVAAAETMETVVLYDGSLGTLPGAQGFAYVAYPSGPTQTISNGGTILDTTAANSYYAGYFTQSALMPTLDHTAGYTVTFTARVLAETHASNDRAGFSIIVLGDDDGGTETVQGIELAFWEGEIWAQEDDPLFTHGEGVAFATTTTTSYELAILDSAYTLYGDGTAILAGPIRDYTAFSGFPDPYETPNFLFLGDDTSSARARLKLDYVAVAAVWDEFTYLPMIRRP
jgi:hypothetical protein